MTEGLGRPAGAHERDVDLRETVENSSVGDLVREVASDLSTLVRQEIQLAKTEVTQQAQQGGRAAGMLTAAGVAGLITALFLSTAAMWTLNAWMPLGWAALIVAVVWAIAAAILYTTGRSRLKDVGKPEATIETLKEDAQWLRTRTS